MPRIPVNFLLIGAQKSGTTWLAAMLAEHPEIFRPKQKELHYFNKYTNYARGPAWYLEHFRGVRGEKAVGECTPNYLWVCDAPPEVQDERRHRGKPPLEFVIDENQIRDVHERVHALLPDVRLIVSLRNPVDRAISGFMHAIRARRIPPSSNILDVGGKEGILGMGFYYRHLEKWMSLFPREHFLILVYEEDIEQNRDRTIARLYRHLRVSHFRPVRSGQRFNASATGSYLRTSYYAPRLARRLFRRFPRLNDLKILDVKISADDRKELVEIYRSENRRLEELLGRALPCWE